MQMSFRDGNMKGREGGVTVRYGRLRDTYTPAEVGWENASVTVLGWDNGEGVDVWLPGRDEALSLSWDDATGLRAALALAELPRPRG
jgi:hypothetical protein